MLSEQEAQCDDLACGLPCEQGNEHEVGEAQGLAHGRAREAGRVGLHGERDAICQDDSQHEPIEGLPFHEADEWLSDEVVFLQEEQSRGSELIRADDLR